MSIFSSVAAIVVLLALISFLYFVFKDEYDLAFFQQRFLNTFLTVAALLSLLPLFLSNNDTKFYLILTFLSLCLLLLNNLYLSFELFFSKRKYEKETAKRN